MEISKNQFEILSLIERDGGKHISQRNIAKQTDLSLGLVNKEIANLVSMGLINNDDKISQITDEGIKALEPYRVKRVLIMAAGFGSRMVPITLNTPKPLVRVQGKPLIETLLDAIVEAEISEVVIVTGYLGYQFDSVKAKYNNVTLVYNPLYNDANNISSALLVKNLFSNAYVCDADLLIKNPRLIRKYEYNSNYLGMYKDVTDDWCLTMKNGYISGMQLGGRDCYHMYGISYWDEDDGKKMSTRIEEAYNMPGGKEKYWDQVALDVYKDDFKIVVRPCKEGDIVEIDSFTELKAIDPAYDR